MISALAFCVVMAMLGLKHEPLKKIVVMGVFGTHLVALTTNNQLIYAFGNAFTATLFQGDSFCFTVRILVL